MFADIDITNIGQGVLLGTSVVLAIAAIFRLFGSSILAPYARKQDRKDDDRIKHALKPLSDELSEIRAEVTYNHGTSLKDAVHRIDRNLIRIESRFEEHDRWAHQRVERPDDLESGL